MKKIKKIKKHRINMDFPDKELWERIKLDAHKTNFTIGEYICDVMRTYYKPKVKKSGLRRLFGL